MDASGRHDELAVTLGDGRVGTQRGSRPIWRPMAVWTLVDRRVQAGIWWRLRVLLGDRARAVHAGWSLHCCHSPAMSSALRIAAAGSVRFAAAPVTRAGSGAPRRSISRVAGMAGLVAA
jgi:hypothetical protein